MPVHDPGGFHSPLNTNLLVSSIRVELILTLDHYPIPEQTVRQFYAQKRIMMSSGRAFLGGYTHDPPHWKLLPVYTTAGLRRG